MSTAGCSTLARFHTGFRRHFGRYGFLDGYLAVVNRHVALDVVAFDHWLHERWGQYEDERGLSMAELIEQEYGVEARRFCEHWLKGECQS